MNEAPVSKKMFQSSDHPIYHSESQSELDLRGLVEAAIMRKTAVFSILVATILTCFIVTALLPKNHEISMVIEPPIMGTDNGVQDFDTVANIKGQIESGAFNAKLFQKLGLSQARVTFSAIQPRDTRLLRVSLVRPEAQTELARNVLVQLVEELKSYYQQFIQDRKERADNDIKIATEKLQVTENQIKSGNEQLKILDERERQLGEQLKMVQSNSEKLLQNRDSLVKEDKNDLASLLYVTTLQQGISYANQLQNELAAVRTSRADKLNDIETIKSQINQERTAIASLVISKNAINNVRVIQEPTVSPFTLGPTRKDTLLVSLVLGGILSLFYVLLAEYWQRAKP